jgi:uncharacterized protein DUF6869
MFDEDRVLVEELLRASASDWDTPREVLDLLIANAPKRAFEVLRQVTRRTTESEFLGMLGAGPLEDFCGLHCRDFIDQIEAEASSNPGFAEALQSMWTDSVPADVRLRLAKLTRGG